jgi:long-chain acyl-CoA synthetase
MACLAVLECGAVVVPTDVQLPDDFVRHILRDSGARWVFTTADLVNRLERLDADVTLLLLMRMRTISVAGRCLLTAECSQPTARGAEVTLPFSSIPPVTTGTSKCVPLSHGNLAFH